MKGKRKMEWRCGKKKERERKCFNLVNEDGVAFSIREKFWCYTARKATTDPKRKLSMGIIMPVSFCSFHLAEYRKKLDNNFKL